MGDDVHEYIELALDTGFSHIDSGQCDFKFLIPEPDVWNLSFATKFMKMKKASLSPSGRADWPGQMCTFQPSMVVATLKRPYGQVWKRYNTNLILLDNFIERFLPT